MPAVTLNFTEPINVSCQIGDTAYFVDTTTSGGFDINNGNVVEIGPIINIVGQYGSNPYIVCDAPTTISTFNGLNFFILFSKDNKANLSTVLGYYADVKFRNDSTDEAEIFSIGMDVFESSK